MTARRYRDEIYVIWAAARADANMAYDAWRSRPGRDSYAVYLAAEDQADAAQADLAAFSSILSAVA
jgi:hypothetical protein